MNRKQREQNKRSAWWLYERNPMNWIKTSEMPYKYAAHHPECDLRVHEGDKDYYACSCGIDQHEAPWDKLTAQGELKSLPPLPEEQGK